MPTLVRENYIINAGCKLYEENYMGYFKKFFIIISMFICFYFSLHLNAKTINVIKLEQNETIVSPKIHDVKFIIESTINSAMWNPSETTISETNQKLLEYDTEGLKLYSIKGKINIFDTDVLNIEKYATFQKGKNQKELLKLKKYNSNSAVEGLNISLQAFILFKYFYMYEYNFLDDIEYQYNYYNFYAKAVNNIDSIYWWGDKFYGLSLKDYIKLPKDSFIELTTEFNEHRLYILDFKKIIRDFYFDSFKLGLFSSYWAKQSFVGIIAENGHVPIIQDVLFESKGVSFKLKHKIENLNLNLRYNYGLDSYIVVSGGYSNIDYRSMDFFIDYEHDIYNNSKYIIFTKINLLYSLKWLDNSKYRLDSEEIFSVGLSLGLVF